MLKYIRQQPQAAPGSRILRDIDGDWDSHHPNRLNCVKHGVFT